MEILRFSGGALYLKQREKWLGWRLWQRLRRLGIHSSRDIEGHWDAMERGAHRLRGTS